MLKPKKGIVLLEKPASGWELDPVWKEFRAPDGLYIERKHVQIFKGKVVGLHPDLAKKYCLKTIGDCGRGTDLQKAREEHRKILSELDTELKKAKAEYSVFILRSGETLERKVRNLLKEGRNTEALEVKKSMIKKIIENAKILSDRIREIVDKIESLNKTGV
jgi:hypothetical protein